MASINSMYKQILMKYQGELWHKALYKVADIGNLENMHLMWACIYHDHCNILSKVY